MKDSTLSRTHREIPTEWFSATFAMGLIALMGAFGLIQALSVRTNPDVAWYLYCGARLLDGARFGHDVVDVNAPLIVLMSTGVEALARGLGASAISVFPGLIFALSSASIALCARLTRPSHALIKHAFLVALAYVLFIQVGAMLGQREHLLLILAMPYVCSIIETADGRQVPPRLAVFTGFAAALGLALKPFFIPVWLALEVFLALRAGFRVLSRPQSLAIIATLCAYAASVLFWWPEYFSFMADSMSLYRAYQPYGDLPLFLSRSFSIVSLAIIVSQIIARPLARNSVDAMCIFVLMLSSAVFVQDKGWLYHWYPAVAGGIILCSLSVAALVSKLKWLGNGPFQVFTALLLLLLSVRSYVYWTPDESSRDELERLVRENADGKAILAFSSDIHAGFPLVNETGVDWSSRFPTMWQVPGLCGHASMEPTAIENQKSRFFDDLYADVSTKPPAMLLVDTIPPHPSIKDFDYFEYFEQDARLAAELARYRLLRRVGRYRLFIPRDSMELGN